MLRAGFIGFGRMGITHYSILNTHPQVEICAICEASKTMQSLLRKYLDVKIFSNYQEMIRQTPIDFVVISTPADSHCEIIDYAVGNNLHAFSEKPFALHSADGQRVIEKLDGKSVVNQVGYVNRFNRIFMEVKKLIDLKAVGEIKHFNSRMYGGSVLKDSKSAWRANRKSGGGCMYEFASHCIDLVIYFFGKPDKVAGSVMQKIFSSNVEDMVSSTLIYENGLYGHVLANWSDVTYRSPTNIVEIFGTQGKIVANRHEYRVFLREDKPEIPLKKGWHTRYITDLDDHIRFYVRGNEFTRQLDHFIQCIIEKRYDNVSDFTEAIKTDMVMEEIFIDAFYSKRGQIPLKQDLNYPNPNSQKPKRIKKFLARIWRPKK